MEDQVKYKTTFATTDSSSGAFTSNTQVQCDFNQSANYCYTDWNTFVPFQNYWYQQTYPGIVQYHTDPVKKSFELVKKLMDKGLIQEPKTIKDFIELVTEISNLL